MRALTVLAAVCGLMLTFGGAAGAHLVANGTLPPDRWNSALLYGFVHTLAALIAAHSLPPGRTSLAAAWAFAAGVILFSGVQMAKLLWAGLASSAAGAASTTPFDLLTPLVPVGGLAFALGWILVAASAIVAPPRSPKS